jgi:hypothetical protein
MPVSPPILMEGKLFSMIKSLQSDHPLSNNQSAVQEWAESALTRYRTLTGLIVYTIYTFS